MDYFGLSEWRKRLGLSIPKMARYVGTNINTWTKWEYGERSPSQAAQRLFSVLQHVERTCINLHKEPPTPKQGPPPKMNRAGIFKLIAALLIGSFMSNR
jgi:transcriptional regulator with XRE-family HTH domain